MFADLPFHLQIIPVTPFAQNCSVLIEPDERRAVIIDPGGDAHLIMQALAEARATPQAIWLTHGHFDHVGGAAQLKEALGVDVLGPHRDDDWLVEHVQEQGAFFGVDAGRSVTPDRWLSHGEALQIGKAQFKVRHCPGHTPGHVIFVDEAHRIGFFGDVLFRGSIGRTDFPRGDHAQLLASIAERILTLPDDFRFIPGHGPPSTVGEERRSNPYLAELVSTWARRG